LLFIQFKTLFTLDIHN